MHPAYGANSGITTEEWWFEVVKQTYKTTPDLTQVESDEMDQILPDLAETLYKDIFSSSEGWNVKEDTFYMLDKLTKWRDQGAGPKIGIVSNFDSRLNKILAGSIILYSMFCY